MDDWTKQREERAAKKATAKAATDAVMNKAVVDVAAELRTRGHQVTRAGKVEGLYGNVELRVDGETVMLRFRGHGTHDFLRGTMPNGRCTAEVGYHYPTWRIRTKKGKFNVAEFASTIERHFAEEAAKLLARQERDRQTAIAEAAFKALVSRFDLRVTFGETYRLMVDDGKIRLHFDDLTEGQADSLLATADRLNLLEKK